MFELSPSSESNKMRKNQRWDALPGTGGETRKLSLTTASRYVRPLSVSQFGSSSSMVDIYTSSLACAEGWSARTWGVNVSAPVVLSCPAALIKDKRDGIEK
jgi:hypothetical protein